MPQIVDTLHLAIALIPLAIYLLVIGAMNISSRPWVVSGPKDTLGVGLAVSGFVIAGPLELFVPSATSFWFGAYVWLFLVALYGLSLFLAVLLCRPRLVIYNVAPEHVRRLLGNICGELDRDARWAGDCLYLPNLGVQLNIEAASLVRNVQLVSAGAFQSFEGWWRLKTALQMALRQQTGSRSFYGLGLIMAGMFLAAAVTICAVRDPEAVVQLREMLHVEP
jgi:hypothetical protein